MLPLKTGQTVMTPGRTIGEGDVALFAGLVGDFTPIHVDETFAQASPHKTRIARPAPCAARSARSTKLERVVVAIHPESGTASCA